jgi:polysaccharide biosynthesis protein VpsJ
LIDIINHRIAAIDNYVTVNGLASYDPYDGLSSPLIRPVLGKNQLALRVWQQGVRLFPLNIRPLIGVRKLIHTKTVSDFASAYSILSRADAGTSFREKAKRCLDSLASLHSPTRSGLGWGLRFPFATRFVSAKAQQANIFQTINALHAFLDGFETFGDKRYLDLCEQGMEFLKYDLGYTEKEETVSWNYWENFTIEIYNISGLMIGLCARLALLTGNDHYRLLSRKLYAYISKAQNEDGSWYYSADARGNFIDGFHTGYILEGMIRAVQLNVVKKDDALARGITYYLQCFFTADGTPRYFSNATFPIDGQNAAQALQTLHFILNVNFAPKELLEKCFARVDQLLWNQTGYYNYKRTRWITYKTPMHRWVTGPMFLALSYLQLNYHSTR